MTASTAPFACVAATLLLIAALLSSLPARAGAGGGEQALPEQGRSLFDELLDVDADGTLRVPFPFPALLQRIGRHLDPAQASGGLSVVLIPLGRSLQRHAAGDVEAFRYPRVIAAVTGEPPVDAAPGHRYLRDRLYVAYHEKAAALEVISYNERGGRFEFQLVHDYRAGARPIVVYANRTLCLACHQNAAPIFSRPSWDETSASPPIAARLAATGQAYYGLPWRHGVDVPDAIDAATARANLLAAAQRLWREACAAPSAAVAVNCRAAALRLALRYRLGGGRLPSLDGEATQRDFVEPVLANWRRRWPEGLAIPDPQLPNRLPFAGIEGGMPAPADAALIRYADIPAAFDPLALRPPLERWPGREAGDVGRFIHALSSFFSHADIALIDRRLAAADAPQRSLAFACEARSTGTRLDLDCRAPAGARLLARIPVAGGRPLGGAVDRLVLPGGESIGALELALPAPSRGGATVSLRFALRRSDRLGARNAAGEAIRALRLSALAAGPIAATLELRAELAPLERAIERLARTSLAAGGDDAPAPVPALAPERSPADPAPLAGAPFRRVAVLGPLLAQLGVAPPGAPAVPQTRLPPRLDPGPTSRAAPWPPELQPFVRQCGQCHAEDSAFPPGFLRGEDERVRRHLAGCAERILYRLEMNRVAPAKRAKTPMPPPAAAHAAGFVRSPDLPAIRAVVVGMLEARGGEPAAVLAAPYATLAPCQAQADAAHRGERS